MKQISTILTVMLFITSIQAKTYTIGSGKWSDPCLWSDDQVGSTINAGDVVIVTGQVTLTSSLLIAGTLQIEKGATLLGAKDITVAKGGILVNYGSTVVRKIVNEGSINNSLFLETMTDIENRSMMENTNTVLAGNNFESVAGKACGKDCRFYANNNITQCDPAEFDANVGVYCAGEIETK